MNLSLDDRLQLLFLKLRKASSLCIEDDTVLQKLQTSLQKYIQEKEDAFIWCQHIGLVAFICESLEEDHVRNKRNQPSVAFALHCLACLVTEEQHFLSLLQQEIMMYFKHDLSIFQENMTLHAKSLKVAESLLSHSSGVQWVIANGLWENLLISSLKSQNIFVQRMCITVASALLLKIQDPNIFVNYVRDLELVITKFRETKHRLQELQKEKDEHSLGSAIARLRFNIDTVQIIVQTMLFETLGKRPLYSQLRQVFDLTSRILFNFNFSLSYATVIKFSKILLLSTLHRMQDKILKFGTAEQYHLDSINSDMLSLTRHMINKGYHVEFLVASFELHKYWSTFCKNIEQENGVEVSKCESVIFVFLKLQVIPLLVLCGTSRCAESEESRKAFEEDYGLWNKKFAEKMVIREEQALEIDRLSDLLREKFASDPKLLNEHCISHLTHFASIIRYFQSTSASAVFQILIIVLKFKISGKPPLENNPRFYLNTMDVLRSLAESFRIECWEFRSFLPAFWHVIWIPGITMRVKVSALQTISTCLLKFLPLGTVHSRQTLANTKGKDGDFDKLRDTIHLCLSDMDWEVRDSALELILNCISTQKKQGPPFDEWFLRFSLLDHVLQAVGDAEPYVQATALAILATVVPVHEIWTRLEFRNVKHLALRAIVRSGENCIKKSGLQLLQALVAQAKIEGSERDRFVIPVVQAATSDPDDAIRLAALKLIRQILDTELAEMGMIDGEFPKVTFQCGKITNLEEGEVESRVLRVICRFCQNGSLRSVVNCSEDKVKAVWIESNSLLTFVGTLVNEYNLTSRLSFINDINDYKAPRSKSPPLPSNWRTNDQNVFGNSGETKAAVCQTGDIEYVLQTSDLAVISKLTRKVRLSSASWWAAETSEEILEKEEVPPCLASVSAEYVSQEIQSAQTAVLNPPVTREDCEMEISGLLEDIFLAIGTSDEANESRAMDCY